MASSVNNNNSANGTHFRTCNLTNSFENSQSINFTQLDGPTRLIFETLKYLEGKDLRNCALLNRFFHRVLHGKVSDGCWKAALEMEKITKLLSEQNISGITIQSLRKRGEDGFQRVGALQMNLNPHLQDNNFPFVFGLIPQCLAVCNSNVFYFEQMRYGVFQYTETNTLNFTSLARFSPTLKSMNDPVACFTVDKNYYYLGHEDGKVTWWSRENATLIDTTSHCHKVISRLLLSNDRLIVAMEKDDFISYKSESPLVSTINILNTSTRLCQYTDFYQDVEPQLLETDGTSIYCPYEENEEVTKITIIDLKTGSVKKTIDLEKAPQKINFTCSKSFEGGVAYGTNRGSIIVIRTLPSGEKTHMSFKGHGENVTAIGFNFSIMVSSSATKLVIWNMETSKAIAGTKDIQQIEFIQNRNNNFLVFNTSHIFSINIDPSVIKPPKKTVNANEDVAVPDSAQLAPVNSNDDMAAAGALVSLWESLNNE